MRRAWLLIPILFLAHAAAADPEVMTAGDAADRLLELIRSDDPAAFDVFAGKLTDAWLAADVLCFRREHDVAARLAKVAGSDRLAAYVDAERDRPLQLDVRQAIAAMDAALGAGDPAAALRAADSVTPTPGRVTWVRLTSQTGAALVDLGRRADAVRQFLAAAETAADIGWRMQARRDYESAGRQAIYVRDWTTAEDAFSKSQALSLEMGDARSAAVMSGNLGMVALRRNDLPKAETYLIEALAAVKSEGNVLEQARLNVHLGTLQRRRGRLEQAEATLVLAARLWEQVDRIDGVAWALTNLAGVYQERGKLEDARTTFVRVVEIQKQLGHVGSLGVALANLGNILIELERWDQAREALDEALRIAEAGDDRARKANALSNLAVLFSSLGQYARALEYHERALEMKREIGDEAVLATTLSNIGAVYEKLFRFDDAVANHTEAIEIGTRLREPRIVFLASINLGMVRYRMGQHERAKALLETALALARQMHARSYEAQAIHNLGLVSESLFEWEDAVSLYEQSLRIKEELGQDTLAASSEMNLGEALMEIGEFERADRFLAAVVVRLEGGTDRTLLAHALASRGNFLLKRGRFDEARSDLERSIGIAETLETTSELTYALSALGQIEERIGNYKRAEEIHARSLAIAIESKSPKALAAAYLNLANVHLRRGRHAEALEFYDKARAEYAAVSDAIGQVIVLLNTGGLYQMTRDWDRAEARYLAALDVATRGGLVHRRVAALIGLGVVSRAREDYETALERFEEAAKGARALDDDEEVAIVFNNIGQTYVRMHRLDDAEQRFRDALALRAGTIDPTGIATCYHSLARVHWLRGDIDASGTTAQAGLDALGEVPENGTRAHLLRSLALAHLGAGDPVNAIKLAHEAHALIARMVQWLGEEQGARARDEWTGVYNVGISAAAVLGDAREALFFMEAGRAGSLAEALDARSALHDVLVPDDMRRAESVAREAYERAVSDYRRLLGRGSRKALRKQRKTVEQARSAWDEEAARIQRHAKKGASIAYPGPDELAAVQARLEPTDALVLFAPTGGDTYAVVVTRSEARVLAVGRTESIDALVVAAIPETASKETEPALESLREMLVGRLGLPGTVRRLLISPAGRLAYLPFALLAADREVVYVPSATTHGLLLEEQGLRGSHVLALGDPDYASHADRGDGSRGGLSSNLAPLPATRNEVEAIGDHTLVGSDATEANLRTRLGSQERWRAVHFACHGLVLPERPLFSALALTADDQDDGFLSALEIFGMQIPADLAVLSACETAKGKVYASEGIVGLTRAFMFAGAPRVICSLWKVDDAATQALMVKFYELWNPKDGGEGVGTAAALQQAQEFVRGHDKWKHPYYWAAWVLWGVPD